MGAPIKPKKCVMIIAGEASGDLHGSKLVRAMLKKDKDLFFCGIGGPALKNAGVRILVDASKLAVVGATEVIAKIPSIIKGLAVAKNLLKNLHPDLLILIDFPDFNFKVASFAKKLEIPVLYYISPQIWAWRPGRIKKIKKIVDHMAVILPFEEAYYKKHEIPVTFAGHPLLDIDINLQDNEHQETVEHVQDCCPNVIGLLPGSRKNEIDRLLPVMLHAARILSNRIKNIKFKISIATSIKREHVEKLIKQQKPQEHFELCTGSVDKLFKQCSLVVVASGTVTLEAAIFGIPMVIVYKVSPVSYWLGRALIRVGNIGLVNLIAGKDMVPELIQDKASPENIADAVGRILNDPKRMEKLKDDLHGIRAKLGGPGASKRVAGIANKMLCKSYVKIS